MDEREGGLDSKPVESRRANPLHPQKGANLQKKMPRNKSLSPQNPQPYKSRAHNPSGKPIQPSTTKPQVPNLNPIIQRSNEPQSINQSIISQNGQKKDKRHGRTVERLTRSKQASSKQELDEKRGKRGTEGRPMRATALRRRRARPIRLVSSGPAF